MAVAEDLHAGSPSRFRQALTGAGDELRRDKILYAYILIYVLAAMAFGLSVGSAGLNIAIYLPLWLFGMMVFFGVWTVAVELPAAIRSDAGSPMKALLARLPSRVTPRFLAGLVLYLSVGLFYGAFTLVKSSLPSVTEFDWDVRLADIDQAMHFGSDPWLLIQPVLGHEPVTRVIEFIYSLGWAACLFVIPLLACTTERLAHLRVRFLACLFTCWIVLGNVVAGLFLSGGPVYYEAFTGDAARFGDQLDYLAFSAGQPQSAATLQAYLWTWFEQGQPGPGTGISAFPSIHVATATLFALMLYRLRPLYGWIGLGFLAVIQLGSVHLAWHYAIDGYFSMIAALLIWKVSGPLLRPFERANPL